MEGRASWLLPVGGRKIRPPQIGATLVKECRKCGNKVRDIFRGGNSPWLISNASSSFSSFHRRDKPNMYKFILVVSLAALCFGANFTVKDHQSEQGLSCVSGCCNDQANPRCPLATGLPPCSTCCSGATEAGCSKSGICTCCVKTGKQCCAGNCLPGPPRCNDCCSGDYDDCTGLYPRPLLCYCAKEM